MLSRNAETLFWIARYVERAENVARLVDMGYRMSVLPGEASTRATEWASVIISAGCEAGFGLSHEEADQQRVAEYLLLDPANPSSVYSCFAQARRNARAVRIALTSQVWESINDAWMQVRGAGPHRIAGGALPPFLDGVRRAGAAIRGAVDSSFLRSDAYDFLHAGFYMERADNTARLLDVKYHVLLPERDGVGGAIDQYHWQSILQAANSLRSHYWVYGGDVTAWNVADFLILNALCPRSLAYCYEKLTEHLGRLARYYGQTHRCHDSLAATAALLEQDTIDTLFQSGLHEFLGEFIIRNHELASLFAEDYGFYAPPVFPRTPPEPDEAMQAQGGSAPSNGGDAAASAPAPRVRQSQSQSQSAGD